MNGCGHTMGGNFTGRSGIRYRWCSNCGSLAVFAGDYLIDTIPPGLDSEERLLKAQAMARERLRRTA